MQRKILFCVIACGLFFLAFSSTKIIAKKCSRCATTDKFSVEYKLGLKGYDIDVYVNGIVPTNIKDYKMCVEDLMPQPPKNAAVYNKYGKKVGQLDNQYCAPIYILLDQNRVGYDYEMVGHIGKWRK